MAASLADLAKQNPTIEQVLRDNTVLHTEVVSRIRKIGFETSDSSVRRWRKKRGVKVLLSPAAAPVEDEVIDLAAQNSELRTANNRLFKQRNALKARGDEYVAAVYQAASDAARYVGKTEIATPTKDSRKKPEEVALWHMTDWQGGKRTESYDRSIMRDRVERYVAKVASITEVQRADHPVRRATLLFTGDMVEGVSIFPGQVWELDGTLFEQMFDVADLMQWTIRQALSIYETVDVVAEYGNHGRLGTKHDGLKRSDNVDRMVYEIVRRETANDDNLASFQTSGDWYQHFTIGNYSALAIHGDEIKGFGGNVPAYGILRKCNAWATGVVPHFNDVYMGHYHQSMLLQLANGGSVFMTGSTESDNIFAQEFVAATGVPSQRVNFIDPSKGKVTAEYRVWLN